MSWDGIDLAGHSHRHECQCGTFVWHQGTRAECLDVDPVLCTGCAEEMAGAELQSNDY